MTVSAREFEQAALIQRAFEEEFAGAPDVMGIGLGVNAAADAPALNVQVRSLRTREALPTSFRGLDVVVEVVGEVRSY